MQLQSTLRRLTTAYGSLSKKMRETQKSASLKQAHTEVMRLLGDGVELLNAIYFVVEKHHSLHCIFVCGVMDKYL